MIHPPNSPITTPTGRRGIVLVGDGNPSMPLHALIQFPDGSKVWMVASILTPDRTGFSLDKMTTHRIEK